MLPLQSATLPGFVGNCKRSRSPEDTSPLGPPGLAHNFARRARFNRLALFDDTRDMFVKRNSRQETRAAVVPWIKFQLLHETLSMKMMFLRGAESVRGGD